MGKYIKLDETVNALIELEAKLGSQQQAQRGVRLAIGYVKDMPTIEVSEEDELKFYYVESKDDPDDTDYCNNDCEHCEWVTCPKETFRKVFEVDDDVEVIIREEGSEES